MKIFLKFWRSLARIIVIAMAVGLDLVGIVSIQAQTSETPDYTDFQNTPVNSILDVYELLTNRHLIRDANLTGVPPISITATGISKQEMVKLIEATLLLNGVAIVPVDDKTSKVIAAVGGNKNPRSEGVKLYVNATDLPLEDEVVSYYMPLDYISAQEAQGVFTQSIPVHSYGAYTVAPSAQAVILTETTAVIRQLIALKELIDTPPARVVSEFVQLNRADAEKTADLLAKLLNAKDSGGAAAANAGGNVGGAVAVPSTLGNDKPLLNEHDLVSGPVRILPDTRSNSLLIVTRPVNMPFLKGIIEQLDQPDAFTVPTRRPLKYVLAQDILPALEATLASRQPPRVARRVEAPAQAEAEAPAPAPSPPNSKRRPKMTFQLWCRSARQGCWRITAPTQLLFSDLLMLSRVFATSSINLIDAPFRFISPRLSAN
jgi:general secretion pathway protein D